MARLPGARLLGSMLLGSFARRASVKSAPTTAAAAASASRGARAPAQVQTPDALLLSGGRAASLLRPAAGVAAPKIGAHQALYVPAPSPSSTWTPTSVRAGVLGFKAGMTADWDAWGVRKPLTVIQLDEAIVTAVRSAEQHGYFAVQVGGRAPKTQRVSSAAAGFFRKAGVAPRAHLGEFHTTADATLPVGTSLTCRHFVPGQLLKVTGTTQGKGFQGAMKRHHFAGQPASHGNSLSHRALGATGCRQDPGKVSKGKKMPGQMGGGTVTVDGLTLYKIDVRRNLLYVIGAVPGKPGTLLRICDSPKQRFSAASPPPFPTYVPSAADQAALARWAAGAFLPPAEEALLAQLGLLPAAYEREPAYELLAPPPAIDPFSILENDEPEAA